MNIMVRFFHLLISLERKPVIIGYFFVIIGLFLYSFTQVDLSLTLSRASIWQDIQKSFQYIGYFNRPLSAFIYILITILLFIFYIVFLRLTLRNEIHKKTIWTVIGITAFILTFSYNAFSYDLFNYVFDAKIVTHYYENPYIHKALDYPSDPMLSFMHWTHRTYPYGPVWLGLTVPLSLLGFKFFLPTLILFKILMTASYIGSAFFIGKILKKVNPNNELLGVTFFALNPLILIEGLVSAHNDIPMIFFSLWALYMVIQGKSVRSLVLFFLSVGVKFATGFLFPVYLYILYMQKKGKKINWDMVGTSLVLLMASGVVFASIRTNFQPWYLLFVLPYGAFVARKYFIIIPTMVLSFFALLQYVPFLYTGNWDGPIPLILSYLVIGSVMLSIVCIIMWYLKLLKGNK